MKSQVYESIEELIKQGSVGPARLAIGQLLEKLPPRLFATERRRLAEFCRRVGWQARAVQLLNPIVRPSGRLRAAPEDADWVEYAANLTFLGAVDEALDILRPVNVIEQPRALLFKAFAHFSQWDYAAALPALESYCTSPHISEYERRVGELNRLSAYVNLLRIDDVLKNSELFLRNVPEGSLLWTNALEIRAQALMLDRKFDASAAALDAIDAKSVAGVSYGLFIEKWRIILESYRNGATRSRMDRLQKLARRSLEMQRWEVARDCDYHRALFTKNEKLARAVYFGTPYPAYRRRLYDRLNVQVEPNETYGWHPNGARALVGSLNVYLGEAGMAEIQRLPHRLLQIVCSDFYRPHRAASLAAKLFPGEYYHPIHSFGKTNQIVIRLRQWLKTNFPNVEVKSRKQFFAIQALEPVELIVGLDVRSSEAPHRLFAWMKLGQTYTLSEVSALLKLPPRSAQRRLAVWLKDGMISVQGSTRNRRFFLKPK